MTSETSTLLRDRIEAEKLNDDEGPIGGCWKCRGTGRKFQKAKQGIVGGECGVCKGSGKRQRSEKSQLLSEQPGKVIKLRGLPGKSGNPGGFLGPPAFGNADSVHLSKGEILASLGCGDWRIFQLANGHKLTVDDFICAWVAAKEMQSRGFGLSNGAFGLPNDSGATFKHLDCGCGCGSVLMTIAWAFPGLVQSQGIEAQKISFDLCKRGVEFNLGSDHSVLLLHSDFRTWDSGANEIGFDLITGTPPYFPLDKFVASENHSQKVRCRVPTRGAASDYIKAAGRLLAENGVFVMVETSRKEAENAVLKASRGNGFAILKRIDVVTREGLPPRFSCWVLCRKKEHHCSQYQIIPFTLRDADQRRTLEYVDAMESMGWIDFENTREKLGDSFPGQVETG